MVTCMHSSACCLKPCIEVASDLVEIGLPLDVRIACDGLQQKFQHAEYFTANIHLIFKQFSLLFSEFHKLSYYSSYVMV